MPVCIAVYPNTIFKGYFYNFFFALHSIAISFYGVEKLKDTDTHVPTT